MPLDFIVRTTQGAVVPQRPQRRWTLGDEIDVHRYAHVTLQLPIYFVNRNGRAGFSLLDILRGHDPDLYYGGRDAPPGGTVTTRLCLKVSVHSLVLIHVLRRLRPHMAGCKDWRRQIQTPDGTPARNPIAVSRFMRPFYDE